MYLTITHHRMYIIIDTPQMSLRGMEPLSQLHEPWGDLQAFPGLWTAQL